MPTSRVGRALRFLVVHNRYREPGGEDVCFASEVALLRDHGHDVHTVTDDNARIADMNECGLGAETLWSGSAYRRLRLAVREASADVVHFHNTFPLISPSAYYAARAEGAAVVQTLHNYRLMCPSAALYRNEGVCEECAGKTIAWPALVHACYRNDRMATGATVAMLGLHRVLGTWRRMVNVYLAQTEFARDKFVSTGLPAERIIVKPNFVAPDPGLGSGDGGYALYAGRLSSEKGIGVLLEAWQRRAGLPPLRVLGDGPLAPAVRAASGRVEWLGTQPRVRVFEAMKSAAVLVFPSLMYESAPMTILEAFATGLPVVASDAGAMRALIKDGLTGLLFRSGDSEDLGRKLESLLSDPVRARQLGQGARREYEERYTATLNYALLMEAYEQALRNREEGVDGCVEGARRAEGTAELMTSGKGPSVR